MTKDEVAAFFDRLSEEATKPDSRMPPEFAKLAETWRGALSDAYGDEIEADAEEIAAYVDGQLHGAELLAFEAKLAASPSLRDEVEDLRGDIAALGSNAEEAVQVSVAGAVSLAGLRATLEARQPLTMAQQRALFINPTLRADYNRLIKVDRLPAAAAPSVSMPRAVARLAMPARAAASSDREINERSFAGATIHIGSAGLPNQFLIRIRFEGGEASFDVLELQGSDGTLAYLTLPPAHKGEMRWIADTDAPDVGEALALLRDPRASGTFRRREDFD